MTLSLAVVGATGAVGREILRILEQRSTPVGSLRLFASARSAGSRLPFAGREVVLEAIPEGDLAEGFFGSFDAVLLSAGGGVSRRLVPAIRRDGSLAIDNSSAFRADPTVPLVVPELNGARIAEHRGVIANPNCTTAILLMALAPLHRAAGVRRAIVASYQAVSGRGARAMEECQAQTREVLAGRPPRPEVFPRPIAFNVLPHVDDFTPDGRTKEEVKVERESRRILEEPGLRVEATCVRVPVLRCHSEAVSVEFERPLSPDEARELWRRAPGVEVLDDPGAASYPTPLDAEGRDAVLVGRCRRSVAFDHGLAFWCVGDQLRKGAALNAVQILEEALHSSPSRGPRPA